MPRILDVYLDSVIYLYADEEEARAGESFGGSGFLVEYPSESGGPPSVYAVTNQHVVARGYPVIRVNDLQKGIDVLNLTDENWVPRYRIDGGDDVAVALLTLSDSQHRYATVPLTMFGTKQRTADVDLGPGDECFMLGRFLTHDGKQQNTPTARFGHLSMMPFEPIQDPDTGYMQEAYLVEQHSLPGYSGSPVFAYRAARMTEKGVITPIIQSAPILLGIDWCHFRNELIVTQSDGETTVSGLRVQGPSGMAGVIPAWKILDILESEVFRTLRKEEEEKRARRRAESPVELDVGASAESDDEYGRFEDLARKLVQVPKTELDEKRKSES